MTYDPDLVVYHDKCMDGFTAAWAIWKRWPEAEFVARNYGMEPDLEVADKHVLIVDFSFPEQVLRQLAVDGAKSVVILDHHKTAAADLEPFCRFKDKPERFMPPVLASMIEDLNRGDWLPILALFDMDRSGAGMAWDFAHSEERPELVDLVEDRDLWRFEHGDRSRYLHLALQAIRIPTFEDWDEVDLALENVIEAGMAIARYRDSLVDEIVERAVCVVIDGEYGMGVDCPYGLASDVGHRLLDDWPDTRFAAAIVRGEQTITYSLRSRDDRADVSALAKKFGGGGHRNAAGFKVPR